MSKKEKLPAPPDKVVVAMSGGVDSSVAAVLLVEQGFDVIGITIKTYNYEDVGGNITNESSCCSLDGINDARLVANKFNFPHYVLDFSDSFKKEVIDNFVNEYLAGRTPNPCVICNRKIKWEELISKASVLGIDYIATGHFSKVRFDSVKNQYILSKGKDSNKDQSYALWGLNQELLSKTIFPLADLKKEEVRKLAEKFGLKNARKGESFEICFVADNNYERFLKEALPELERKVDGGEIIFDGKIVGKHKGYPFYTIGQRKGVGKAFGEPVYVADIDPSSNTIRLGRESDLMHKSLIASKINLISVKDIVEDLKVIAKVRYKDNGNAATVKRYDSERIQVIFDEPKRAITPGQSVVLYDGDDLVGGGVIEKAFD
jgi:tRNA-specific 2-thiouridylase